LQAAGQLVPVNERLPTQNLAILERIFDSPLVSRFSAKQLVWLMHQIESLICFPENAASMRASKKVRLPDWLPAHVAKYRVDAIFRDGLEVWGIPGFPEMCARARAGNEEYFACYEEYVEMATGVAKELSAKYKVSVTNAKHEASSDGTYFTLSID
jgi:hypothetical protein